MALRSAGLKVVLYWDVLKDGLDDACYLGLCAKKNWVALTADSDVHNKSNQRILIDALGVRVFRLTRNHWPWRDKLRAFTLAIPAMLRLLRGGTRPFIARINRDGKICSLDTLSAEARNRKAAKSNRRPTRP